MNYLFSGITTYNKPVIIVFLRSKKEEVPGKKSVVNEWFDTTETDKAKAL